MDRKPDKHKKYLEAYDQYSDELFGYTIMRVRNRDLALDITQEAFVRTWEYIQDHNVDNVRAFLYRVAYNLIVDHSRKRRATYSIDELSAEGIELRGENDQVSLRNQIDSQLAVELLDKLPETYRHVLTLRYVQDLSVSEIADMLGERPNSISVRIHRGVDKLKEILEQAQSQYSDSDTQ